MYECRYSSRINSKKILPHWGSNLQHPGEACGLLLTDWLQALFATMVITFEHEISPHIEKSLLRVN
jgi:hypothetical protein